MAPSESLLLRPLLPQQHLTQVAATIPVGTVRACTALALDGVRIDGGKQRRKIQRVSLNQERTDTALVPDLWNNRVIG